MAERTSAKKLTADELIVQKLKETFERKGSAQDEGSNVWVMAAAVKLYQGKGDCLLVREPGPSHCVRVVLRTSDALETNPYVDGSDFFLAVDEQSQTVEFVWEDERFADTPLLHGSEIITAIRWTSEMDEALLCLRLEDPFRSKTTKTHS